MTMTLHHGSRSQFVPHTGICLTDDEGAAANYSGQAWFTSADVNLCSLKVVEVAGYDRDENIAPGDDGDDHGADVLVYLDEDPMGYVHKTWRLMSQRAVDALAVQSTTHVELAELVADLSVDYADLAEAISDDIDLETYCDDLGYDTVARAWAAV